MKIITTIEQIVEETPDGLKLISQRVVNSEIIYNEVDKYSEVIQFTDTDVRYGIISLKKNHPLAAFYSAEDPIRVSIDGIEFEGKWHKVQKRIGGLTKLFNQANVVANADYTYEYDYVTNTVVFEKAIR